MEWDGPVVRCYSFGCENGTVHVFCLVEGIKEDGFNPSLVWIEERGQAMNMVTCCTLYGKVTST